MSSARSVVYFAYLGDEAAEDDLVRRRLAFMDSQLRWLSELVRTASEPLDVLVPYVAPRAWDAHVHDTIGRFGFRIDPASVEAERRNRFEYQGFRAMKELAEQSAPEDLIYYCHSKGIVHLDDRMMGLFRLHTHVGLTADLSRLTATPAITKAGLFPHKFGWCWYNFFWIKAAHMARLPVEESGDRYHFEELIGDRGDNKGYQGVLPLIDRLSYEDTGIAPKSWYRPEETTTAALVATYDRYALMTSPDDISR